MRQNDSFNAKIVIGSFVRLVKIVKKLKVLEIWKRIWDDNDYSAIGYTNL